MNVRNYSENAPFVGCKCGARTYNGHVVKIEAGYSAHAYSGVYGNHATTSSRPLQGVHEPDSVYYARLREAGFPMPWEHDQTR